MLRSTDVLLAACMLASQAGALPTSSLGSVSHSVGGMGGLRATFAASKTGGYAYRRPEYDESSWARTGAAQSDESRLMEDTQLQRLRGGDANRAQSPVVDSTAYVPPSPTVNPQSRRTTTPPPNAPMVGPSIRTIQRNSFEFPKVGSAANLVGNPDFQTPMRNMLGSAPGFMPQTPTGIAQTPARGWPARFRSELELLKQAMSEYETSQRSALSALGQEKERTRQLQDEKNALSLEMEKRIAEMEEAKASLEQKAVSNEQRLLSLSMQDGGDVQSLILSLEEEKVNLARRADEAVLEVQQLRAELAHAKEAGERVARIELDLAKLEEEGMRHEGGGGAHVMAARLDEAKVSFQERAARAQKETEELHRSLAQSDEARRELMERLNSIVSEKGSLETTLDVVRTDKERLQAEAARLADEKEALTADMRARLEAVEKEKESIAAKGDKAMSAMQDSLKRSTALQGAQAERIAQLEVQAAAARKELEASSSEVGKMKQQVASFSRTRAKLEKEVKSATESRNMIVQQLRDAEKAARTASTQGGSLVKDWRSKQAALEGERSALTKQLEAAALKEKEAVAALETAERRRGEAEGRLQGLEERCAVLEEERGGLRRRVEELEAERSQAGEGVTALEARLAVASRELRGAQESLHEAVQAKNALEVELGGLRASDKDSRERLAQAQQNVESLRVSAQEARAIQERTISDLEEAVQDSAGRAVFLEARVKEVSEQLEQELHQVRDELAKSRADTSKAASRLKELEKDHEKLQATHHMARDRMDCMTMHIGMAESKAGRAGAELLGQRDQVRVHQARLQDMKRRVAQAEEQRQSFVTRAEQAEAELMCLRTELHNTKDMHSSTIDSTQDAIKRLQEMESAHETLVAQCTEAEMRVGALSGSLAQAEDNVSRLMASLAKDSEARECLQMELDESRAAVSAGETLSQSLTKELRHLGESNGALALRAELSERSCSELQAALDQSIAEKESLKAALSKMEGEVASLHERIRGADQCASETEELVAQLRADLDAARSESNEQSEEHARVVEVLRASIRDLEDGHRQLEAKVAATSRALTIKDAELAAARTKVCALEGVRVALVGEVERLGGETDRLRELLKDKSESPGRGGVSRQQHEDIVCKIQALEQVKASLEAKITPSEMRISALASELKQAEDSREKTEAKLAWLKRYSDQATKDLKEELSGLREELAIAARGKQEVEHEKGLLLERAAGLEVRCEEQQREMHELRDGLSCREAAFQEEIAKLERGLQVGSSTHGRVAEIQAELDQSNNLSLHQWGLIDAAGKRLKDEMNKVACLAEENRLLMSKAASLQEDSKESNERYAEMYGRYMEARAEKATLEKRVSILTTQKKSLEERALNAESDYRRMRSNLVPPPSFLNLPTAARFFS